GESANPNLKAEESLSYEIGLDQALTQNSSVSFSVYQNEVDNMIQKVDGKLNNISEATLRGGELTWNWKQDDWFIDTAFAYVQAKDSKTNI
ncbi:TonB-dependent receptor domain-containing protein, partial [Acinetobacter variabilis]|uniref:TonB-dependent receptor domain-containing protein n=1 Tax=Acinetobacter variabilis TaxID=70346 RepID=UPI0030FB5154